MKKTLQLSAIMLLFVASNLFATDWAVKMNGVDTRIMYPNDATMDQLNGVQDFTIELWVKPDSIVLNNKLIIKRFYSFALTFFKDAATATEADDTDNKRRFYFTHYLSNGAGGFNNIFVNTIDNVITIGEWNHIVAINNSVTNTFKMYVNGVDVTLEATAALPALEVNPVSGTYVANMYLGYASSTYTNATFDKVRIKKEAIDIATTQTSITSAAYAVDAKTVALFNFNEGTGTTSKNEVNNADINLAAGVAPALPATWVDVAATAVKTANMVALKIYPNPAIETVEINTNSNAVLNSVSISDLTGKIVKNLELLNQNKQIINVKDLSKGIYFIKIQSSEGEVSRKLVIQ